jgi:hypothetical protein
MPSFALLLAALLTTAQPGEPADTPPPRDVIVVCPAGLRPGLAPWLAYRTAQGYQPLVVSGAESAAQTRESIRNAARGRQPAAIVLVGDAVSGPHARFDPELHVPTGQIRSIVSVRFGGGPTIASDAYLADFDDDGVPDVPIGRLPADDLADLAAMIDKTIRYEQDANFKAWRRRLQLVAGAGGFGAVADRALEAATQTIVSQMIPPEYGVSMTYASLGSPFFPGGERFRDEAVARHNEGCLFFIYIGHAGSQHLDAGPHVRQRALLAADALGDLAVAEGHPIAVLLACSTAEIDGPRDSLGEQLLRAGGGPVAVIGGSSITMPYGMGSLALELADQHFDRKATTLGEALHLAKRELLLGERRTTSRVALDLMAKVVSPAPADLPLERLEHAHLMQLVGDPLLSIRHPHAIQLAAPPQAAPGDELIVDGRTEIDGRYRIELVAPLGRAGSRIAAPDEPAELAVYRSANDVVRVTHEGDAKDGQFRAVLRVPPEAQGSYFLRAYVEAAAGFAMGAAALQVVGAAAP